MYIHIYIYIFTRVHICRETHIRLFLFACTQHVRIHIHIYVYIHIYTCVYIYTCMYTCEFMSVDLQLLGLLERVTRGSSLHPTVFVLYWLYSSEESSLGFLSRNSGLKPKGKSCIHIYVYMYFFSYRYIYVCIS